MHAPSSRTVKLALVALAATASACASRVWMLVPAKVELAGFQRIGIARFEGPDAALAERATREFQERLLEARPGVLLVALDGDVPADPAAAAATARERGLDGVFLGRIEFEMPAPSLGIASSLAEVRAQAEVIATLTAELVEADGGATVWLRSCRDSAVVASAGLSTVGRGGIRVTDVQRAKADLIPGLAQEITFDFRDRFLRRTREQIPPAYRATYPDGVEVYVPPDGDRR